MTEQDLPPDFVDKCKAVTAKRPKTVIDHILRYGHITTEELKDTYGYNHPPRAVRDVKEQGIPIDMFRVEGGDGRKIAAYKFGDPSKARFSKLSGRTAFAKILKERLIKLHGARCAIYLEKYSEELLQIDHRIPYEIAGDNGGSIDDPDIYMLLSSSANRAKSWACEHCKNWIEIKDVRVCKHCYWAFPENYTHIAMEETRRLDLIWRGKEIVQYEQLKEQSGICEEPLQYFVKKIIKDRLK